ncbi:hypothetical protein NC653_027812 [Populus alba x Populus x berolinensis]|uniref:Polyphenol oxidase C-terminal domain-containing protein n=1 Tax=Populus alba x Populus x berolinensis TaxID=444605 RepID=A0AAD6Q5B2_9ROSI|nr:hypothetical protein NC653_027812 [Populus alba x Populus x berolinensis]
MSTLSFSPFFPKPQQVTKTKRLNQTYVPRVSCKATDDTQNPATRRDVLIGLGGLYSATNLADRTAYAKPITSPDLTNCKLVDLPNPENPTDCCSPLPRKIIDFRPPSPFSPLRTRRAAHLVDEDYVAKYAKAISLMKSLPEDDPRNFYQQANVHCAYCDDAYEQVGFPKLELDFVRFDVFINDDLEIPSKPENTEFAGSFVNVSHKRAKKSKTRLILGITELLEDLETDGDDSIVVALVPRSNSVSDPVVISGVKIEFVKD